MTLDGIIQEIKLLSLDERKRLISVIVDTLTEPSTPTKKRSLLELEGLGKEIWQGIDAQQYVNEMRDEWGKDA